MNKKGFTLIELLSVIAIIAVLGSIAIISLNSLLNDQKNKIYINYEKTLKTTVENYMIDDFENNNGLLMPIIGNNTIITVNELLNLKLIDNLKDPNGGSCDDSYVIVTRNNNNEFSNNLSLSYKVCLMCENYQTEGCNNS